MIKTRASLALIALALSIAPRAAACTIFTVVRGETVLFCGNEDQEPNSSYIVLDTNGKYGALYFATPWLQWPLVMQSGVNEKGLCYDDNWIPEEALARHPERKTPNEWIVTLLMKECATVEEVLSKIFTYDWGDSISYQIHFADATGDAVVIHPGEDGELTYTRKPKGDGRLISTNFNLEELKTGGWHCDRYETADAMLSRALGGRNVTVAAATDVLMSTHQAGWISTIYSTIFDLKAMKAYVFYESGFSSPRVLDIKAEIARAGKGSKRPLGELFQTSGK
jgi:hypothetical protein